MTDIRDEVAAALDSDDFRDRHERAMRDHILGAVDLGVEHRCDDLCSDAILSRLLGKHAVNEYPWQPDAARGLTVVREDDCHCAERNVTHARGCPCGNLARQPEDQP